jgi:hypothetical protein
VDGEETFLHSNHRYEDNIDEFENLDDDISSNVQSSHMSDNPHPSNNPVQSISPEKRQLNIPSTCLPRDHSMSQLEFHLRERQANRYIIALREVIAEKSFQYTNVIRVANRKSVVTRARNTITKLNQKISFYAKIYNRCRAALKYLGADEHTLQKYRILKKQDVKASSAIIDPNIPGSSSLRLSWIWQMSSADPNSPSHLRECIHHHPEIFMILLTTIF